MKTTAQKVYESFSLIHPVESFEQNPRRFMRLLKRKGFDLTQKQLKRILAEIK
jgi:hypothetical protein